MLDQIKLEKAKAIVRAALTNTSVVYCSFGKDSMVLLHMTREMGFDLPVIFNRIPVFAGKQAFANRVIEHWGLTVHSFLPQATAVAFNPEPDVLNYYPVRDGRLLMMPVGVLRPVDGLPFACGLFDLIGTPQGSAAYPWDVAFVGHKSCDHDPLLGDLPLGRDVAQATPSMRVAFPLRHFTDADVWAYTEQFDVPYNTKRYDKANGYREFADRSSNNDYYHACLKCMDPGEPETVVCPRFGSVPNVSASVRKANLTLPAYVEREGVASNAC